MKVDAFKTIYSNKTFDYMSCSLPILMAVDGVSKQLVEDSKSGIYAEPENIDDIVRCVNILFNKSKHELNEYGDNGLNYVSENFDREKLGKKYITNLKSLINNEI